MSIYARSLLATAWGLSLAWSAMGQRVHYDRDVSPILSDRCYACHGPDDGARKAGLRLDQRAGAVAQRGRRGPAIVPGRPDQSLLLERVTHVDPGERMPPPDRGIPALTDDEVATLRQWIDEGAEWSRPWALEVLPDEVIVPRGGDWGHNEIDAFVLDRMRAAALRPATPAGRERLLRRVSFDLTGLPPERDVREAFLADEAPGAYERLVDRLLSSPEYGERMATQWLDAARYADTRGYQADRAQSVWRYRDWVIDAFNENLPYDQFLTWQLAGDLLPNATREQRLATAFNRLHRQTEEGGTVEEEFRVEYVVDRVNTFGTAVLGLTIECARCHDHKFDPISQAEFYRLFAFFQNIDESGQTSHFTDAEPVPALMLPDEEVSSELVELADRIAVAERAWERSIELGRDRLAGWLTSEPSVDLQKGLVGSYSFDEIGSGGALLNRADPKRPGRAIDSPTSVPGIEGRALALDGENAIHLPGVGHFDRADPFTFALWVRVPEAFDRAVVVHHSRAALDAASRGYQLLIEDGHLSASLVHFWPANAIAVRAERSLPVAEWVHVAVSYDGSSRAAGLTLFVDGEPAPVSVVRDQLTKDIVYHRTGAPTLAIGQRFRDRGLAGGHVDDFRLWCRELAPIEVAELVRPGSFGVAVVARPDDLVPVWAGVDPECCLAADTVRGLRDRQRVIVEQVPNIMTMVEMAEPRPAHVLNRGAYDDRGAPVTAGTPVALPAFGDRPPNRLGLAQWVTEPRHPLTARVAVNRLWQSLFGKGLVATSDNFGSQGARPSHPRLLDWLARRFVASGWDVKAIVRLMVTSATYRQDSAVPAMERALDPDNTWLSRSPSYRWNSEMIRDGALAVSGLLVRELKGPPVRPYQPAGLWAEKSGGRYTPSSGDGLYRRSVYTFWKRTSPPPAMVLFDSPRRMHCVVQRQRMSTPQQALVLMNDPQMVECARFLAERAWRSGGSLEACLERVFRLAVERAPSAAELAVLRELYREQLADFEVDAEAARHLLAVGEKARDEGLLPVAVHAAATVVASTVLNLEEVITKR